MNFYVGCAIWSFKGWVGSLFPQGTRQADFLRLYSRTMDTVEGNTTFYAVPNEETVARWVEATPAAFRFCPKLPRDISHAGALVAGIDETAAFIARMQGLGERLGPIFLQLPPSYGPQQLPDLQRFLEAWPTDTRLAVEVRHPAFFQPDGSDTLNALLTERGVSRVLMDTRPLRQGPLPGADSNLDEARDHKPNLPLLPELTASFAFVRYIGHPQFELNASFLDEWATRVTSWINHSTEVFFFCHCPDDTFSPPLCAAIRERLVTSGVLDPPEQPLLQQASLF